MTGLILFSFTALAATLETTALVGGRTAPESAILVPSAWEGEFEPSPLAALDTQVRLDAASGGWTELGADAWGYVTDADASELGGHAGLGWGGSGPFSAAVRYDLAWFPLLAEATNGRGEAMIRATHKAEGWSLSPKLALVDRRYFNAPTASFWEGELGAVLTLRAASPLSVDLGLSGQANAAGGLGFGLPWGGQLRSLERLNFQRDAWRISVEHRLGLALEGEIEAEAPPVFTPLGDYAEDVDALSGGGYVQNRFGVQGAFLTGRWTFSAGGLARLRSAEADELAAAYGRSFGAQARVERRMGPTLALFASAGVSTASLAGKSAFLDVWGWSGVVWTTPGAAGP